jgi:hypothetical protein
MALEAVQFIVSFASWKSIESRKPHSIIFLAQCKKEVIFLAHSIIMRWYGRLLLLLGGYFICFISYEFKNCLFIVILSNYNLFK